MIKPRRPPKRLSDADKELLVAMRERGEKCAAIAARLGVSVSTVRDWCLKLAVEPPNPPPLWDRIKGPLVQRRGDHIVRRFTPDEDAELTKLAVEGHRIAQIARRMGRHKRSIAGRMMTLARKEERAGK